MKDCPKTSKYSKHMIRIKCNKSCKGTKLSYCSFGLVASSYGYIMNKHIETVRILINKIVKDRKIVIRVFPDRALTKKPIEVRMGNGKGDFYGYVFFCKPNRVIIEFDCFDKRIAYNIYKMCSYKLPIRTKLLVR